MVIGLRVPKRKFILVHNLVCWIANGPRPVGKTSVDHGNRGRACNHFTNLKWASGEEQANNRSDGCGRKCLLPFKPEEGETVYDFRGSPGIEYTGPKLQFTSHGRILRQGRVSQIQRIQGRYPKIVVVGCGGAKKSTKVHILAWSAYHGPDAKIPSLIHHKDHDTTNFRPSNLIASSHSHNAIAAHDAGRYSQTRSKRQRIAVVDAVTGKAVGQYASQMEAARILRANQGMISQCLGFSIKTFKGIVDGISRKLSVSRV